jgi:excisionase family DNA binding protein
MSLRNVRYTGRRPSNQRRNRVKPTVRAIIPPGLPPTIRPFGDMKGMPRKLKPRAAPQFYTTNEAAEKLGISPGRVRFYIREERLPAFRFGRDWQIDPTVLDNFKRHATGRPPMPTPAPYQAPPLYCEVCGSRLRKPGERLLCWRHTSQNARQARAAAAARRRRATRRAEGICPECGGGAPWCKHCRTSIKGRRTEAA